MYYIIQTPVPVCDAIIIEICVFNLRQSLVGKILPPSSWAIFGRVLCLKSIKDNRIAGKDTLEV